MGESFLLSAEQQYLPFLDCRRGTPRPPTSTRVSVFQKFLPREGEVSLLLDNVLKFGKREKKRKKYKSVNKKILLFLYNFFFFVSETYSWVELTSTLSRWCEDTWGACLCARKDLFFFFSSQKFITLREAKKVLCWKQYSFLSAFHKWNRSI